MYRKIYITASEMLEMRKQVMSNHDIAKSLDISVSTVIRYIGKQGERMENLAAFADPKPTRRKTETEAEAMTMVPKYEPKPIKEAFTIGDMNITLNHDTRVMYYDFEGEPLTVAQRSIPYDNIPELVQFLAWAMRERMDVM